jgi:hypothetical protein
MNAVRRSLLLAAALLAAAPPARGAEAAAEKPAASGKSEEELAKQAQNPVADIYSFPFQDNVGFGYGPNGAVQNVLNFQPVIPVHLGALNLITRTIVPIVTQPSVVPGVSGSTSGLGDVNVTAFLSPAAPGAVIWGVGPVASFPTATSSLLGSHSTWGLGASVVVLTMPGPWVLGVLANNVWSVAGAKANAFLLQYFVNYNFGGGWYVTTSPILTADWTAPADDQWTVPFGAGFGKLQRFGRLPVNLTAAAFWNAVHPKNLPHADWTLRLQVTVLL